MRSNSKKRFRVSIALLFIIASTLITFTSRGKAWAGDEDLFAETPGQWKAEIDSCFKSAEISIANGDIQSTRQQTSLITYKIDKHGKKLTRDEKKFYRNRNAAINRVITQKVDSLIKTNLEIVVKDGPKAGYAFRQDLFVKGVSESELAPVDQAIAERSNYTESKRTPSSVQSPDAAKVEHESSTMAPESGRPPNTSSAVVKSAADRNSSSDDAAAVAKTADRKMLDNRQSASNGPDDLPSGQTQPDPVAEKYKRIATVKAVKVRSLIDAGKIEEARTVFQIYQRQIQQYLDADVYQELNAAIDTAVVQDQTHQASIVQQTREIERLLDANKVVEAFALLGKSRPSLKPYMDKSEFKALEKKVGQAYINFIKTQVAANATMHSIQALINENKPEDAYATFESHSTELKQGLSPEAYNDLNKEITSAYNVIRDNKKKNEILCKNISSLIASGNSSAAWTLFNENQMSLRQHLDNARYLTLASDVEKAHGEHLRRQVKAQKLALSIDSLIDHAHEADAHRLFEANKASLRSDLADDKRYSSLKDRQSAAYADFLKQQVSTRRTSQKIEYLIRNHEGKKAYDLFRQESPVLKKHCARDEYAKLEGTSLRANNDFELRRGAAQQSVAAITLLMDQKRIERAYALFQKSEDDIDFYLQGDASVDTLQRRITQEYRSLQERKQWASLQIRQIHELIEKRRGNLALAQFNNVKIELAKYTDRNTLDVLAAETDRANKRYRVLVNSAQQDAAHIGALLAQNQIEDAYNVFTSLQSDLEFYLEQTKFDLLKTKVEASNSVLMNKKQDALRIIKSIDGCIQRNQGDSAYLVFHKNEKFLAHYLNPLTYKGASSRALTAKADYEKNCRNALTLEKKYWDWLKQDRIIEAHEKFQEQNDYLEHYLPTTRFDRLKAAITAAYDAFMAERKKARASVASLVRLIRQYQGVEAQAQFDKCDRTLARYLPPDEYLDAVGMVTKAYNSTLQGRRQAKEAAAAIEQLIEKEEIPYACATFKQMRTVLARYMPDDDFTALETEISYVGNEYDKKVKQAKQYAKGLKQLVSNKDSLNAYKAFHSHRRELAKYLDEQAFAELESTISKPYK